MFMSLCLSLFIDTDSYIKTLFPGILAWGPMPRISIPAWDSANSCSRSAKWTWDRLEGGCHRPFLEFRNLCLHTGLVRTEIDIGSLREPPVGSRICGAQGLVYGSRPPGGPMPVLLNANRNLENPRPGIEIHGMGLRPLAMDSKCNVYM